MEARVRTGSHTLAGRRSSNQDAVYTGRLADGRELMVVADGMGGHRGGETASRTALATLVMRLQEGRSLADAIIDANAAVHGEALRNPELNGMGTTLVAMLRSGDRYLIANVGDSRAYRVTATGIEQITADHSFLSEALSSGQLTADEARRSRWRNALTRAIGTDARVEVDLFGPFDVREPHVVLLCSDGLHGVVEDEVICRTVLQYENAAEAARKLAEQAYEAGSKDNITVAIVAVGDAIVARNGSDGVVAQPISVRKPAYKPVPLILSPTRNEPRTLLQKIFPFLS